ncbi:MAG TPA: twin-arginine translocase TatA/TatE family subunit [Thermomicrobiales bacterium]|nr:twin-arginine translocase TatA/TatE family subunit [Thermomicrobiales bacterium]
MNIMGIGPQEIMIIAVIALLVFGPGKLPEVMGQAGKLYRDFRRVSDELSGEFEKTIAEARSATAGLTSELGSMSKEVSSVTNSVKKDLGIKNSTSTAKGKTTGAKTGTAAKSTSKSTSSGSSTSKVGAKGSTSTTTSSASKAKTAPATTATTAKKVLPVASREDPNADVSLFDPTPIERTKRARKAVPSVIADPTPRTVDVFASDSPDPENGIVSISPAADDAVSRARARRKNAGYARTSA